MKVLSHFQFSLITCQFQNDFSNTEIIIFSTKQGLILGVTNVDGIQQELETLLFDKRENRPLTNKEPSLSG